VAHLGMQAEVPQRIDACMSSRPVKKRLPAWWGVIVEKKKRPKKVLAKRPSNP